MSDYQDHELANVFPMHSPKELKVLVNSMKTSGYLSDRPIVIYENKILDGRNRYKAAEIAGVEPVYVTYDGNDPKGYMFSLNRQFRKINQDQLYIVAASLIDNTTVDLKAAAKLYGLTERKLRTSRTVVLNGSELLIRAVSHNKIRLNDAAESGVLKLKHADQDDAVASVVDDKEYPTLTSYIKKDSTTTTTKKVNTKSNSVDLLKIIGDLRSQILQLTKINRELSSKLAQSNSLDVNVGIDDKSIVDPDFDELP